MTEFDKAQAEQRQETLERLFNAEAITAKEYGVLGGWSPAYREGRHAALHAKGCLRATQARLRQDADFWQGWHDWRPYYENPADRHCGRFRLVEDPTRPGGYIRQLQPEAEEAADPIPKPETKEAVAPPREELRRHSRMPDLRVRVVEMPNSRGKKFAVKKEHLFDDPNGKPRWVDGTVWKYATWEEAQREARKLLNENAHARGVA